MANRSSKIPDWTPDKRDQYFRIIDDEWSDIEAVYGRSIPQKARDEIEQSIRVFLDHIGGEQPSASVNDAKDKVARRRKALLALLDALKPGNDDLDDCVDRRLNWIHQELFGRRPDRRALSKLRDDVAGWIVVCNLVIRDLESDPPSRWRQPGECWKNWVVEVTEICAKHGLPITSRNDHEPHKDDDDKERNSPFTLLISELEGCLPKPSRTELKALPAAIRAARAAAKPSSP
jgi:hypothetical protein